jgi:phosphoglycerate dehydrogenase-like enzyme
VGRVAHVVPPRSDAEIITVNSGTAVDGVLLDQVPSARLVLTTTSGFDHLDLREIAKRGIVAGRCPMARRDAVVETSLALLLDGLRRHGPLSRASQEGRWARGELPSLGMGLLGGSTVGVVGLGVIGRTMVNVLTALGVEVVVTDPRVSDEGLEAVSLQEMASRCDAVTLHCRLEPGSRQMIDRTWLSRARGVVLVNTARGGVVDVEAAVAGVRSGNLSYLGLDVFPEEPWPALEESDHPNITYLPHAAGFHSGLNAAVAAELEAAIGRFVADVPIPHQIV